MNNTKIPKKYTIPQAIDLSGKYAIGIVPMGFCSTGHNPSTTACKDGSNPVSNPPADCSPVGNMPEYGKCLQGGNVAHGCVHGSLVNNG